MGRVRPVECIAEAGDVVFIPCGWWHTVLNVDDSVAITQNYVARSNMSKCLRILATRDENLISGCPVDERVGLGDEFIDALWRETTRQELTTRELVPSAGPALGEIDLTMDGDLLPSVATLRQWKKMYQLGTCKEYQHQGEPRGGRSAMGEGVSLPRLSSLFRAPRDLTCAPTNIDVDANVSNNVDIVDARPTGAEEGLGDGRPLTFHTPVTQQSSDPPPPHLHLWFLGLNRTVVAPAPPRPLSSRASPCESVRSPGSPPLARPKRCTQLRRPSSCPWANRA